MAKIFIYIPYCRLPTRTWTRRVAAEKEAASAAANAKSAPRVFVGTMRRFARAFLNAVDEFGSMDRVQYARVHDIIGPNAVFVDQSGTLPRRFDDFSQEDSPDRAGARA